MNQCFFDKDKRVVIKNLNDSTRLEREVNGAKILSEYVNVPKVDKLDTQTILMSFEKGSTGDSIDEKEFNFMLICLFKKIKNNFNATSLIKKLSINQQLKKYISLFEFYPDIVKSLRIISKATEDKQLFPVHGDLQRQNIIFTKKGLTLIDFEHFSFAPQELEIVNSLFFNDANCLDVEKLIPFLISDLEFSQEIIGNMLVFFSIKELTQGRNSIEVQNRLIQGIKRLSCITNKKTKIFIPDIIRKQKSIWTSSSCFA